MCQAHDQVQNQYLEKDFDLDVECFAGFAYINIPPVVFMSFGRGDFCSKQLITNFTRHIERIVTWRTVLNLRELSALCNRYGDVASQLYQQFDELIHPSLDLGESTDPDLAAGDDPITVKLVTPVLSRMKQFRSDVFSMLGTINSYRDGFQDQITTVAESILQSRVDQEAVRRLEALNYATLWSSNPMFGHPGVSTTVNPSPMLPFSYNAHNGFFSQTPGLSQLPMHWGYNPINPSG